MTTIVTIDMGGTGATHAAGAREALSVPSMTDMGQSYAQANSAYGQANSAYADSNTRVLKAGDTMTGQLNISSGGLLVTGNSNFDSGTLFVNSVTNRIGVGTTNPQNDLDVVSSGSYSVVSARNLGADGRSELRAEANNGQQILLNAVNYAGIAETITNATSAYYIGTETTAPLIFKTNNAEQVTIVPSGNFGIKTNNPTSNLHVVGNANITTGINTTTVNATTVNAQTFVTSTGDNVYATAINAYGAANTRLSASGGTLSGDLIITGNLTVSGNQTILNTEVLTTEDADIILLSNTSSTPALNAGLIINRGTSTNTFLRWDEATDKWGWSDSGTTTYYFEDLRQGLSTTNTTFGTINTSLGTINTSYQAAYAQANTAGTNSLNAYGQANAAYSQANSAYGAANNRVLKAGDTMTGQLNISAGGLLVTDNVGIGTSSAAGRLDVRGGDVFFNRGTGALGNRYIYINKGTSNDGGLIFQRDNTNDWQMVNLNTSGNFALYSYGTSSQVFTIQRADGNVGIGTTSPATKLDIRGIIQGQTYSVPDTSATAQWVKLGTLTMPQMGYTARIRAYIHSGFNAANNQDFYLDIFFKTSNASSVDGNGFAGNSWYYTHGFNASNPQVKWKANAAGVNATTYELFMYLPNYTYNSHYIVEIVEGVTWAHAGSTGQTDPGSGSSTVCVSSVGFNIPLGNVGIGTTSPWTTLHVNGAYASPQALIGSSGNNGIFFHSQGSATHTNWVIGQQRTVSGLEFTPSTAAGGTTFSTPALVILSSSGNVGIGITNPSYRLVVSNSGGVGGEFDPTGVQISGGFGIQAYNRATSQYVPLQLYGSKIILDGGNVGIGTTTPQRRLDVTGSGILASFGSQMGVNSIAGIHFGYSETPSNNDTYKKSAMVFERTDNHNQGGNASGKIHFLLHNTGSTSASGTNSAVLTLDTDGNGALGSARVGIANTAPNHGLSVNGTAFIGGNTTIIGGTTTIFDVRAADAGYAMVRVGNSTNGSQTTGAVELTQDGAYGGGMFYNGDGSPSFATGETAGGDVITFYRMNAGTRVAVFEYPYSANTVTFKGDVYATNSYYLGTTDSGCVLQRIGSNLILNQGADSSSVMAVGGAGALQLIMDTNNNETTQKVSFQKNASYNGTEVGYINEDGNMYINGTLTESSSIALKENINPITNALELVSQICGVTYDRKDGSAKNRAGLIAEHVEKVLPDIVQRDCYGSPAGIQYTNLIAYLVESIKELKAEIDVLKSK